MVKRANHFTAGIKAKCVYQIDQRNSTSDWQNVEDKLIQRKLHACHYCFANISFYVLTIQRQCLARNGDKIR